MWHRPTLPPPHGCSCCWLLSVLSGPFSTCSERLAASGLVGPLTPFCSKRRDWRWRWLELIRASPCLLEQREFPSASKSPSPPSALSARLFLKLSRHFCLCVQSCLTLCDLMHCSPPASVHGISQARIVKWIAISSSRGSYRPRDQTSISCIGRQILYRLGKPSQHFLNLTGLGESDRGRGPSYQRNAHMYPTSCVQFLGNPKPGSLPRLPQTPLPCVCRPSKAV